MNYSRVPDLPFSWSYEELQSLPLFMREHIYKILDEFIEQEKQNKAKMKNQIR
jgi:hypothetical protein